MPRRRRYGMSGVIFHVMNRGSRRGVVCHTEADFAAFEDLLRETLDRQPVALIDYCIMSNHFHFVIRPDTDYELIAFMHRFTSKHAIRWRVATRTIGEGAVYQARYKAVPVQSDEYFYTLARYVHGNPVRAGIVSRAEQWRWGSLWHRLEGDSFPLAPWPVEWPRDWLSQVNTTQRPADVHAIRKSINRGYPLGNQSWQEEIAKSLGIRRFDRGPGRPRQR